MACSLIGSPGGIPPGYFENAAERITTDQPLDKVTKLKTLIDETPLIMFSGKHFPLLVKLYDPYRIRYITEKEFQELEEVVRQSNELASLFKSFETPKE